MNKRRNPPAQDYCLGIERGEIPVLSKAITLTESTLPEHREIAGEIIRWCLPRSGRSVRVGITGIPGVGKSSFIESLGLYLGREYEKKIAVLAIDPTSSETKGSVLGDKVRMHELSRQENVYIRPSPSSGALGGVSKRTSDAVILCEAAGFDTIFIETVGVGQSEITCHSMVDFFMLLMITGAGDEIQGIKKGVLELADSVVITKADNSNRDAAERTRRTIEDALRLHGAQESGWIPRVYTCSSLTGYGIRKIWECVAEHEKSSRESGYFEEKRKRQLKHRLREELARNLEDGFYRNPVIQKALREVEREITEGVTDPYSGAGRLTEIYFQNLRGSREK